jgi:hydroquinone glucosyltransferase
MPATLKLLESLPSGIQCTFLPPINKQDLPQDLSPLKIDLAISQSMPSSIRDALISLLCSTSTTPPVPLVVDFMATQALVIARELNHLSFIYFPLSAMSMSLLLHLPTLHEEISCEYKDHIEPIHLLGCNVPIRGQDLPSNLFHDRSCIIYDLTL